MSLVTAEPAVYIGRMETPSAPSALPRLGGPASFADAPHRQTTERIIGAAIAVHRELGPGFLEAAYEEALCLELLRRDIPFDGAVIVEIKAVREIEDVHLAIALAYLKATSMTAGLILNFSEAKMRIRRVVRSSRSTADRAEER